MSQGGQVPLRGQSAVLLTAIDPDRYLIPCLPW
jgi:hypothetical protein